MIIRRFFVTLLILLHVNLVLADTVDDVQIQARAAGTLVSPTTIKGIISGAGIGQLGISGMGALPAEVSGLSVMTPEDIASKGADAVTRCNDTTARKAMTPSQLATCDGVLTAATISSTSTDRKVDSAARAAIITLEKNPSTTGSATSLQISTSTTDATCTDKTTTGAASFSDELCNKSYPFVDRLVTENLNLVAAPVVDDSGNPVIDPLTGKQQVVYKDVWSGAENDTSSTDPDCDQDGRQCLVGPLCKTIDGQQVCRNCWQRQTGYTCYNMKATLVPDCGDRVSGSCQYKGDTCDLTRANGTCVAFSSVYSCPTNGGVVTSKNCTGGKVCVGSLCFDTSRTSDPDFARAVVGLEGAREAGVYVDGNSTGGLILFKGVQGSCTRPAGPMKGIAKNCCDSSSGAKTNQDVIGGSNSVSNLLVGSALGWTGSTVSNIGSQYMYDFMMSTEMDFFKEKAVNAVLDGLYDPTSSFTDLLANPSFSMYGFTLTTGTPTALIGTNTLIGSTTVGETQVFLYFNPYMLAIAIIIMVVMKLRTCEPDEVLLSMRRGANLCVYLGSHCSRKLPWPLKTCIQYRESWCCWDSRLAKEIVSQGQKQLYGYSPPQCRGLTIDEFQKIDFSKLDLKYIMDEVSAKTKLPSSTDINTLQGAVGNKINSFIKK